MTAMLEQKRAALEHAELQLVCADMIDAYNRRIDEMAYWRGIIKTLKREIAENEAATEPADPINLQGSGPLPMTPREGQD